MRKQKAPAENVVKSQKGSALVIFPPFSLVFELWNGSRGPVVGKQRGYTKRLENARYWGNDVKASGMVIWRATWGDGTTAGGEGSKEVGRGCRKSGRGNRAGNQEAGCWAAP